MAQTGHWLKDGLSLQSAGKAKASIGINTNIRRIPPAVKEKSIFPRG
jgi:hypothetical protein